jgi:hypothetical protein
MGGDWLQGGSVGGRHPEDMADFLASSRKCDMSGGCGNFGIIHQKLYKIRD